MQIGCDEFKNLLTDGCDKPIEVAVREKWLRKLSEKQLQRSRDDVHVLPLAVLEVQFLYLNTTGAQLIRAQQGELLSTERSCSESSHGLWILCFLRVIDRVFQFNIKRKLAVNFTVICLEA